MKSLLRAHAILGVLYAALLALLAIPFIQTHTLFLHAVNIPWSAKFDSPEYYGLPSGKTLNIKLNTTDNITLGAWFVLSNPFYHALPTPPPSLHTHVLPALQSRPTILFFHGNAGNRAFHRRVRFYTDYSTRLAVNIFAIDYRGFGDSGGAPSEAGLARDARAAWDWLLDAGARPEDVLVMGHSLGTAVATTLAAGLSREGVPFRGLVLMSPFSSLRTLLDTYSLFGVFPLMKPLALIPGAPALFMRALVHTFDTLSALPAAAAPVLLVHAEDDWEIPHAHADALFGALLEPRLPPLPAFPTQPAAWSAEDWAAFNVRLAARGRRRAQLVTRRDIPGVGALDEFSRETGARVGVLKTREGGHDALPALEGVQDVIRASFGL